MLRDGNEFARMRFEGVIGWRVSLGRRVHECLGSDWGNGRFMQTSNEKIINLHGL